MFWLNPSVENVVDNLIKSNSSAQEAFMILIAEQNQLDVNLLISTLNKHKITFFGGIFPKVIYDNKSYANGLIAIKLKLKQKPQILRGIDNGEIDIPDSNFDQQSQKDVCHITFVDGLSAHIAKYIAGLYNKLGEATVLGAGAGFMSFQQKPCIFSNEGIFENVAVLASIENKCSIGYGHGWTDLKGPFIATKTNKNIIEELNWNSAYEVYKNVVEEDSQETLNPNNFSEIAKSYPFGIFKEGEEKIVRDPIAPSADGGLICVGEVPENSVLFLLKGEKVNLVEAAQKATNNALGKIQAQMDHIFVVDCISRTLFLGEEYQLELDGIKKEIEKQDTVAKGVLSLGEIVSCYNGYFEFLNKSIVIGALYQPKLK